MIGKGGVCRQKPNAPLSLPLLKAYWRPKKLWAFCAKYPFQDFCIVATCSDPSGEYESFCRWPEAKVEDFVTGPVLVVPSGIALARLPAVPTASAELLMYGYTETDLLR
jgi:hypothetical protein